MVWGVDRGVVAGPSEAWAVACKVGGLGEVVYSAGADSVGGGCPIGSGVGLARLVVSG